MLQRCRSSLLVIQKDGRSCSCKVNHDINEVIRRNIDKMNVSQSSHRLPILTYCMVSVNTRRIELDLRNLECCGIITCNLTAYFPSNCENYHVLMMSVGVVSRVNFFVQLNHRCAIGSRAHKKNSAL